MGIGLALASWFVKGTAIATALAVLFGVLTSVRIAPGIRGRRKAILAVCLFPFVCLSWFFAVFLFQAYVNEAFLYRDPGIGHTWQTPLPNGYAILLIDEKHDGMVFNPASRFSEDGEDIEHANAPDAVSGVRTVQVAGTRILGGAGATGNYSSAAGRDRVDFYFLLDTEARTRADFGSYEALAQRARELGIAPRLEPLYHVYRRYRHTWFDVCAALLLVVPMVAGGLMLRRRIVRLRDAEAAPRPLAPEMRSQQLVESTK
jgi:hypothetical protein